MKIGCSSRSFHDAFENRSLDLFAFLHLAVELGFDGVEPLARVFPSVSQRFLTELRETLAHLPLEISAVSVSNDFAYPDPSERRCQCEDITLWTFVCRDLGVRVLRTFTGDLAEGIDERQAKSWVYECYESVLPAAERAGVTLAVENHSRVLGSPGELVELVMHFGSDCLQLCPDPRNFLQDSPLPDEPGASAYASLAEVARFAVHSRLEVLDGDFAGGGGIDLARVLDIYRRACYDGYLSLEYLGDGDAREALKRGIAYLRTLLGG